MQPAEKIKADGARCPSEEDILALVMDAGVLEEPMRLHIESCPHCAKKAADWRSFVREMKADAPETFPCNVTAKVMSAIEAEENPGKAKNRSGRLVTFPAVIRAVAAVLAALFTGIILTKVFMLAGESNKKMSDSVSNGVTVGSALEWLVSAQEKNGSWDPVKWGGKKEYEVSLTGMALLAFARSNNGTRDLHHKQLMKAVDYLILSQDESGRFGAAFDGQMYNHGIATAALLEADLLENERVRESVARALKFTLSQQLESGGWGYDRSVDKRANMSVTAWQLTGLFAAIKSGVNNIEYPTVRGVNWVRSMLEPGGGFGYQMPGDSVSSNQTLTAMGAYCLLGGVKNLREMRLWGVGAKAALDKMAGTAEQSDYYHNYFLAAALSEKTGGVRTPEITIVHDQMKNRMIRSGALAGSWEPDDKWGSVGGRLYATIMATLSLESGTGIPQDKGS